MKITIGNERQVYIKLSSLPVKDTLAYVKCQLLFNASNTWIGVRLMPEDIEGLPVELPSLPLELEPPHHNAQISVDRHVDILFDAAATVSRSLDQDCNLDVSDDLLVGIEIILWNENSLFDRSLAEEFF